MIVKVIGLLFLVAVLVQIGIFIWSSLARLKGEKEARQLYIARFQQLVSSGIRNDGVESPKAKLKAAWEGYRNFVIKTKTNEGGGICSFYLVPQDKKTLPPFKPGQYLTFNLNIPGQSKPVIRCYSLSDSVDKDYYRVSVKKIPPPKKLPEGMDEPPPPGVSSSYFYDELQENDVLKVRPPSGEFFLDLDSDSPVVLIGGGVGITPVLSMLNTLIDRNSKREIWFLYGIRNFGEHIQKKHLQELGEKYSNLKMRVFYSQPAGPYDSMQAQMPKETLTSTVSVSDQVDKTDKKSKKVQDTNAELVDTEGSNNHTIPSKGAVIGRYAAADINLDWPYLSGNHARIFKKGSNWYLEDLNSRNGTLVNGSSVKDAQVKLKNDDMICFGDKVRKWKFVSTKTAQEPVRSETATASDLDVTMSPNVSKQDGQRVSIELIRSILPSNNYDYYMCGPGAMMEAISSGLKEWGVPESKIHFENFGPASVAKVRPKPASTDAAAETSIEVNFSKSGKKLKWNPAMENLLDFAEDQGIAMDSGCRAGNCGACVVRVIAGRVHYPTTPGAPCSEEECLTCLASPQSDLSLDA